MVSVAIQFEKYLLAVLISLLKSGQTIEGNQNSIPHQLPNETIVLLIIPIINF